MYLKNTQVHFMYLKYLRGSTPFEDMIFYLRTDSNEICSAYAKLKINDTIILEKILIFALVFEKITIFMFLRGILNFFFLNNRSQKPSMLEQKQGQFWNLHRIPNKTSDPDFRFFFVFFFILVFFWTKKK